MTTLFNLFCPLILNMKLFFGVIIMMMTTLVFILFILLSLDSKLVGVFYENNYVLSMGAVLLICFNLISLVCYSYPVTTTLSFNFSVAVCLWNSSLIFLFLKPKTMAAILPSNSPWYLIPFLSMVELVSLLVRPVTLSFRLLANMSAGHILLSLICKMSSGMWLLGSVFGMLELMVCVVQAFVFFMLIKVYLEEGLSH